MVRRTGPLSAGSGPVLAPSHSPAHPLGEHDVQPAGGAELPATELGRAVRVEREPGESLEQVLDGDPDQRA